MREMVLFGKDGLQYLKVRVAALVALFSSSKKGIE
jgi:hypothetical protein